MCVTLSDERNRSKRSASGRRTGIKTKPKMPKLLSATIRTSVVCVRVGCLARERDDTSKEKEACSLSVGILKSGENRSERNCSTTLWTSITVCEREGGDKYCNWIFKTKRTQQTQSHVRFMIDGNFAALYCYFMTIFKQLYGNYHELW